MRGKNAVLERIQSLQFHIEYLEETLREAWSFRPAQFVQKDIEVLQGQVRILRWVLDEGDDDAGTV